MQLSERQNQPPPFLNLFTTGTGPTWFWEQFPAPTTLSEKVRLAKS